MRIRYLVEGHTQQVVTLELGKKRLQKAISEGNLIVDDETQQFAKLENLTEDSQVTVWPVVQGG